MYEKENEELALKVGFEYYPNDEQITKWKNPDGKWCKCPDFYHDIGACFKFIYPELRKVYEVNRIEFVYTDTDVFCYLYADTQSSYAISFADSDTESVAFAEAARKVLG